MRSPIKQKSNTSTKCAGMWGKKTKKVRIFCPRL